MALVGSQDSETVGRLIIHIGPPKTATTSLQVALQAVKIPKFVYLGTFQPRTLNNTKSIFVETMKYVANAPTHEEKSHIRDRVLERMQAGIHQFISEEMFLVTVDAADFHTKLKRLYDLFGDFSPLIVISLREPKSALRSLYQELYIKQKIEPHLSFSEFLGSGQALVYDYRHLVNLLESVGLNNRVIVTMDKLTQGFKLSDLTLISRHTDALTLEKHNVTSVPPSDSGSQFDIPAEMAERLTESYQFVAGL